MKSSNETKKPPKLCKKIEHEEAFFFYCGLTTCYMIPRSRSFFCQFQALRMVSAIET